MFLFFFCHNTDRKLQQFCSFTTGSRKQEAFPVYCDMKHKGMAVLNKYIFVRMKSVLKVSTN